MKLQEFPPTLSVANCSFSSKINNSPHTGQILFADAGFECLSRGERSW